MTNGTMKTLALAGAVVMATGTAAVAQDGKDGKDKQLARHAEVVATYAIAVTGAAEQGISRATRELDPATCHGALAAAEKLGIKDDDRFYAYGWSETARTYAYDSHKGASIAYREAKPFCAAYAKILPAIKAFGDLEQAAQSLSVKAHVGAGDVGSDFAASVIESGKACLATMEKLAAGGLPAATGFALDGKKLSADDVRTQICQGLIDWGNEIGPAAAKAKQAGRDEIAKKYKAAGIKGKRLELFIDYDDVYWRGKGCQIVDDVKALAKAKTLHHWLENADGSHTIRTYTFKGDSYTVKDRTYKREKDAWKGCK